VIICHIVSLETLKKIVCLYVRTRRLQLEKLISYLYHIPMTRNV